MSQSLSGNVLQSTADDTVSAQGMLIYGVLAVIAAVIGAQTWLVFSLNINWDEFYFLSHVHDHVRGTLDRSLQTFHVHLFGWLAHLPVDEIGQITAGRAVMLACECGTAALIYAVARQFVNPFSAVFGSLAYLTAGFTLTHGMSFRADPLATFLLMSSLCLLIVSPLKAWQIAMAGLCGALAVVVTIKSGLYLPAFAAALVWRMQDTEQRSKLCVRIAVTSVVGLGCIVVLYLWHAGQVNAGTLSDASISAGSAAKKTLFSQELLPRDEETMRWALGSVAALAMIGFGFAQAGRGRMMLLALFVAPLLSVVVYRNAFPYFFPFIIAPAMIVAAVGVTAFEAKRTVLLALVALMTMGATSEFFRVLKHDQVAQKETLAAVHAMFPNPVAYIDRNAMVPGFPRAGFFMSTWGMEKYRADGKSVFADIVKNQQPLFLIVNSLVLETAMRNVLLVDERWRLREDDAAVLRQNFVHHWGAIWVAGKAFDLADEQRRFNLMIDGPYTLESEIGVQLDGRTMNPGETVELTAGSHVISAQGAQSVVLKWGQNLVRPVDAPSPSPIYFGF